MTVAMLLAAGEGRRMQPLTLTCPKPLLRVAGRSLIERQLDRLADAGIRKVVINIAYLGEQIREALGDGSRYGVQIDYSPEPAPLETGGALSHALHLLGDEPFLLVNGDIWLDYPLSELLARRSDVEDGHLVLVTNPSHNPQGDFGLTPDGKLVLAERVATGAPTYTFSGLSLLHPRLVRTYPHARDVYPLSEALRHSIERNRLTGEVHEGYWLDVGTPERLRELESYLLSCLGQ